MKDQDGCILPKRQKAFHTFIKIEKIPHNYIALEVME